MNRRADDPTDSDFMVRRRNEGSWPMRVLTGVLSAVLVFLVLYFFNDTVARVHDTSAQLVILTTKLTEVDLKLVHVQDALDLASNDRAEVKLELEDLRKQVEKLRGMK